MPSQLQVWNGERAHVGQWRDLEGVAVIAPAPGIPPPSTGFIERCCHGLAGRGFRRVVTPALAPGEIMTYLEAEFVAREHLHVLVHHLNRIPHAPSPPDVSLQRASESDVPEILELDRVAFDDFWRFDHDALLEARTATPHSRFRIAVTNSPVERQWNVAERIPTGTAVGYCITGRNRSQGFLQRLAVAPAFEGRGLGKVLVRDSLEWLVRRRARTCVVNTQESNDRARALYESCGFELAPSGLYVMTRPLATGDGGW